LDTHGRGGLSGTSKDVSALVNSKRAKNKKEMLSFLGLASFEQKYLPNFAGFERVLRNVMVSDKNHYGQMKKTIVLKGLRLNLLSKIQ
jgi:hypothetical protein